jgi:hypothetical protein
MKSPHGAGHDSLIGVDLWPAVAVLTWNVEPYPDRPNTYDSPGEAHTAQGDTARAIEAYRRSIELDFLNANAYRMPRRPGAEGE